MSPNAARTLTITGLALLLATSGCSRSRPSGDELLQVAENLAALDVTATAGDAAATANADAMAAAGFRASFPRAPQHERRGDAVETFVAGGPDEEVYQVAVVRYGDDFGRHFAPNPSSLFAVEAAKLLEQFGGEVVADRTHLVAGRGSRDFALAGGEHAIRARWIAAGRTLYLVAVEWPKGAPFAVEVRAKGFIASFALTDAAPADTPLVWSRALAGHVSLEVPSAPETDAVLGLTITSAKLPLPAADCAVIRHPLSEGADAAEATELVTTVARKTAVKYLAAPAEPVTAEGQVAGHAARVLTYEGAFGAFAGGGEGRVRIAFFTTPDAIYALMGRAWEGGDALVDRCWASLREEAAPPAPAEPAAVSP